MTKSWAVAALLVLAALSSARAVCDDINQYLVVPSPMTGDMEINLDDVDSITCEEVSDSRSTEEIVVDGGTLTLKSSNNVRFVNVGFTVMSGAALVFDMPKTKIGPNSSGGREESGFIVDVKEGASATFLGKVVAKEADNVFSIFRNYGSLEFKKSASFTDSGNVVRHNSGTLKFRGNATFKNNKYLALSNEDSGYVRFSKAAVFEENANSFDGAWGCSVTNLDSTGTVIFAGDASFTNDHCSEGVSVYNAGTMKFSAKASFNDNSGDSTGGALYSGSGSLTFKGAAEFNNNFSDSYGGGLAVAGGDVTFEESATFTGNSAEDSGGAFAVLEAYNGGFGTLTFEKPDEVYFTDNFITYISENEDNCTIGEVEDGATLIGFPGDDVCVPATE